MMWAGLISLLAGAAGPPPAGAYALSPPDVREVYWANPAELVRVWIGAELEDFQKPSWARRRTGVVVRHVKPGTPAAKAGIQPGDVIAVIQDQCVRSTQEVAAVLKNAPLGRPVSLELYRSGKHLEVALTAGAWPDPTSGR